MGKPRIILDTNVLIGAMVADLAPDFATPAQQLDRLIYRFARQNYDVCFSHKTMAEFEKVAVDVKGLTRQLGPTGMFNRLDYVRRLKSGLKPWQPGTSHLWCRDANDMMFLNLAQGVDALFIISRDNDILSLRRERGCQFWAPERFARQVVARTRQPAQAMALIEGTSRFALRKEARNMARKAVSKARDSSAYTRKQRPGKAERARQKAALAFAD